jgi:hypothetical protein
MVFFINKEIKERKGGVVNTAGSNGSWIIEREGIAFRHV